MSVMKFVSYLVMLRSSYALSVFGSTVRPLLLCKIHSLKPINKIKIMDLFIQYNCEREVYCERKIKNKLRT